MTDSNVAGLLAPAIGSAQRERSNRVVLPGIGVTESEERLVQAVLSGCTLAEAWRRSYNANCKEASAMRQASATLAKPRVSLRVAHLTKQRERRALHDPAFLRDRALETLVDCISDSKPPNVRVNAAVKLGEIAGLFHVKQDDMASQDSQAMRQAVALKLQSLLGPKGS